MLKRTICFISIILLVFSLTGCKNKEIEKFRKEVELGNKSVQACLTEWDKNSKAIDEFKDEVIDYIYQSEKGMPDFDNYKDIFLEYDEMCNEVDTVHQLVLNSAKKNELEIDKLKKNAFYKVLNSDSGSVVVYYYIDMGYKTIHLEFTVQSGKISKVEYNVV